LVLTGCGGEEKGDGVGDGWNGETTRGYRVEDGTIHDDMGRVLILRGFNYANDHKFPDETTGEFLPSWASPQDFVTMAAWGFNSVRLIITWEAVEPERGIYDEVYLERIRDRLDWAQATGQWVIIDMHQDLYSRTFGGDGAPLWAVFTDGIPYEFREPWWLNFIAPALLRATDNFFANREGVLDSFVDAWGYVVERLGGHPAVIGFDLLNEPFPGSFFLLLGKADREIFNPFYHKLLDRLTDIDSRHIFFVEPNAMRTNMFIGAFPTEMDSYEEAEGRLALAPHLYDPFVTATGTYSGNDFFIRASVNGSTEEAVRLAWGLWYGEWSVWGGEVLGYEAYLQDQLAVMDEKLAGWSYWNYSLNEADLTSPVNSPEFLHELVRPQLSAVAGRPLEIDCQPDHCRFRYEEKKLAAPTEILIPDVWSNNTSIDVTPDRRTSLEMPVPGLSKLAVFPEENGTEVLVTLGR